MTATIAALGAVARACADLAAQPIYTKAPPPVAAAIYDWRGYYPDLNGGWVSSANCWDFNSGTPEACHDAAGTTVDGQIGGYRWQMGQMFLGLEGQGNWPDRIRSNASVVFPADINQTKIDALELLTGQIGYAFNNMLVYAKGGAAVTSTTIRSTRLP